jgi:transposase-like protein
MASQRGRSKWYNEEFKMAAVKLALSTDKPIKEIAEDLGVSDTAVRNWVKLYGKAANGNEDGFTPDEHRELVRLRRDLKRVTEERDILKKALGILSTELP